MENRHVPLAYVLAVLRQVAHGQSLEKKEPIIDLNEQTRSDKLDDLTKVAQYAGAGPIG
jgi:hypothetical protein